MEVQVQELIDRIRRDGVDEAERKAREIVASAEEKARGLVAEAEAKAQGILDAAEKERAKAEESGKAALEQAARNLLIAFRESVGKTLSSVVSVETQTAFSEKTLEEAIPLILSSWKGKDSEDLSVLLPLQDLGKFEAFFTAKLSAELKKGVELKPMPGFKAGFRIVERKGEAYYDFSAEAVAEMLSQYLNARLQEIMKRAVQEH
jgi:V/A-type H+/Na+-transporting ATPase subunit E